MTDTATTHDASEAARHRLVEELISSGALHSAEWIAAFKETPREVFASRFFRDVQGERTFYARGDDDFLDAVYTDDSLVTRWDATGTGTSSSTMPSLMALMLEAFPVGEGDRVLEIGTGTGYNAALLCHRLGDDNVTSVDIDPELTAAARERLAGLGYEPTIVTGDGREAHPAPARYNGILATCAVRRIPAEWLRAATPGAPIVVNIGTGIACLRKAEDGAASGTFLEDPYGFMMARSTPDEPAEGTADHVNLVSSGTGERSFIALPDVAGEPHDFMREAVHCRAHEVALNEPDVVAMRLTSQAGERTYCLVHPGTRSWARISVMGSQLEVWQGGPLNNLATERIQRLAEWIRAGRPNPGAYQLHVDSRGQHTLSRGQGDSRTTWALPL
ncbi:methyltransferase domain-containing protein [Streptomyces sp. JH002]|uniref:methyltransferase domain-containing protein n=1 Tax=Streptomyces sp. JH002 TaxID=2763259 RepID=UPI003D8003F8